MDSRYNGLSNRRRRLEMQCRAVAQKGQHTCYSCSARAIEYYLATMYVQLRHLQLPTQRTVIQVQSSLLI